MEEKEELLENSPLEEVEGREPLEAGIESETECESNAETVESDFAGEASRVDEAKDELSPTAACEIDASCEEPENAGEDEALEEEAEPNEIGASEERCETEDSDVEKLDEPEARILTEEEMRDARYLPRELVIFDENASDSDEINPTLGEDPPTSDETDEEEIYSLNFFDEEIDEEKEAAETKKQEPEEREPEPYDPKKPRKVDARFDFVELFVFTLAIVIFITSFIIRHSVVVGRSMENTLFEGDRLLVSDLFYTPDYNDIIVFQDPETNGEGAVVKRIIGLPGDVIEIKENGSIIRNGTLLLEEYVYIDGINIQGNRIVEVPEGEYFVLGDHRNMSEDSRSESFGTIKEEAILGRVLLRFYPFEKFGPIEER